MYQDIKERTYNFALRIIRITKALSVRRENHALMNQVLRSGTSIGANVEEAVASYSRDEYVYKMTIALKEARETHYWLRLIGGAKIVSEERLRGMIDEAGEIKKVLGAIVSKLRKTSKRTIAAENCA